VQQSAKTLSSVLETAKNRNREERPIVLAEERQRLILSLVNTRGSISITEIKRKLRVSRETIRRDIVTLDQSKRLRKTHGGAVSLEQSEPEMNVREVMNPEGKRKIGSAAAGLVPDGASIIIASGTTTQAVAEALMGHRDLTVFTNSVIICSRLMGHNGNRVYMLGGEVQPINGATLGRDTTVMLANYFADFVFIGAGAISPAGWLMDYTREEGELHSTMLQSARTAVVVADHGKFGRFAPIRVGNFEKVTHLITDRPPDPEIVAAMESLPLDLLIADGRDTD
jgi:DeoR/GlpR family transcriptional regulator of sugar metabolism